MLFMGLNYAMSHLQLTSFGNTRLKDGIGYIIGIIQNQHETCKQTHVEGASLPGNRCGYASLHTTQKHVPVASI